MTLQLRDPLIPLRQRGLQLSHTREQLLDQRFTRPRNQHTKIMSGVSDRPTHGQDRHPSPTAEQLRDGRTAGYTNHTKISRVSIALECTVNLLAELPPWLLAVGGVVAVCLVVTGVWWMVKLVRAGRSVKVFGIEIGAKPEDTKAGQPSTATNGVSPVFSEPVSTVAPPTIEVASRHRSLLRWRTYVLIEPQELIHVDHLVDSLTRVIAGEESTSALTVSGIGGLGKTAITCAAVQRVATQERFTHIVWASAKNTHFSTSEASATSVDSIYWHDVLAMIARQIDCVLSPTLELWEQDLRAHIEDTLEHARLLIVVDNLEVIQAADNIIHRLRSLGVRWPHKIVATTRWAVTNDVLDVQDVRVPPLGPRETHDLVRLVARDTDSDLAQANDEELLPIYEITDGNPFLIKLIVRRFVVTGQSLQRIIEELATVSGEKLGTHVRGWLFDQSLDELRARSSENEAVALLSSFCLNDRGGALRYKDIRAENTEIADERFDAVLDTACRLGLVRPSDRNQRYSIHSLLYEYTCPLAWIRRRGELLR